MPPRYVLVLSGALSCPVLAWLVRSLRQTKTIAMRGRPASRFAPSSSPPEFRRTYYVSKGR